MTEIVLNELQIVAAIGNSVSLPHPYSRQAPWRKLCVAHRVGDRGMAQEVLDQPSVRECQPLAAVFGLGQRLVRRYFDHRQGSRVSIWRIGWSAMRLRTSAR